MVIMKKITFLLAVLISLSFPGQAQQQLPLSLGLKGGVNFADLRGDGAGSNTDGRTSFHAGLFGHIHLNKNWAIQPELMFSGQGAKYAGDRATRLSYLNIPVLLQYMFDNGFRVQTGPQLGFLLSARSVEGDADTNIKDNLKTIDLGWNFGVGYIAPSGFGVDARYVLGLTDISKNNADIKNSVWQIGAFYQFGRR